MYGSPAASLGRQDVLVTEGLLLRPAEQDDLPAVVAIFARYVAETVVTFQLEPPTLGQWQNRLNYSTASGWPFLVATVGGSVVGYAYAAPWETKAGYRHTVESSVYLAPEHTGRGYGRVLLEGLLAAAAAAGARQVIAVIADSGSAASRSLHRAAGFTEVGRLTKVGFKHNRWLDVVLMQASLDPGTSSPP